MAFEIDKSVPLPANKSGKPGKYPWREMEVGDSFFIPDMAHSNINVPPALKANGFKIATRRETQNDVAGIRVWRIQ